MFNFKELIELPLSESHVVVIVHCLPRFSPYPGFLLVFHDFPSFPVFFHILVYASGGKTARVDVRIFVFLLFCTFLTRFHVLVCHFLDVCFSGVLGGGGWGVGGV